MEGGSTQNKVPPVEVQEHLGGFVAVLEAPWCLRGAIAVARKLAPRVRQVGRLGRFQSVLERSDTAAALDASSRIA
eukprot:2334420-Pyramimonas_sp.AAC.1